MRFFLLLLLGCVNAQQRLVRDGSEKPPRRLSVGDMLYNVIGGVVETGASVVSNIDPAKLITGISSSMPAVLNAGKSVVDKVATGELPLPDSPTANYLTTFAKKVSGTPEKNSDPEKNSESTSLGPIDNVAKNATKEFTNVTNIAFPTAAANTTESPLLPKIPTVAPIIINGSTNVSGSTPTVAPTVASDSTPTVAPTVASDSTPTVAPTVASDSTPTVAPTVAPIIINGTTDVSGSTPTVAPAEETAAVLNETLINDNDISAYGQGNHSLHTHGQGNSTNIVVVPTRMPGISATLGSTKAVSSDLTHLGTSDHHNSSSIHSNTTNPSNIGNSVKPAIGGNITESPVSAGNITESNTKITIPTRSPATGNSTLPVVAWNVTETNSSVGNATEPVVGGNITESNTIITIPTRSPATSTGNATLPAMAGNVTESIGNGANATEPAENITESNTKITIPTRSPASSLGNSIVPSGNVTESAGSLGISILPAVAGNVSESAGSFGNSILPAVAGNFTESAGSLGSSMLPAVAGNVTESAGSLGNSILPAVTGNVTKSAGSLGNSVNANTTVVVPTRNPAIVIPTRSPTTTVGAAALSNNTITLERNATVPLSAIIIPKRANTTAVGSSNRSGAALEDTQLTKTSDTSNQMSDGNGTATDAIVPTSHSHQDTPLTNTIATRPSSNVTFVEELDEDEEFETSYLEKELGGVIRRLKALEKGEKAIEKANEKTSQEEEEVHDPTLDQFADIPLAQRGITTPSKSSTISKRDAAKAAREEAAAARAAARAERLAARGMSKEEAVNRTSEDGFGEAPTAAEIEVLYEAKKEEAIWGEEPKSPAVSISNKTDGTTNESEIDSEAKNGTEIGLQDETKIDSNDATKIDSNDKAESTSSDKDASDSTDKAESDSIDKAKSTSSDKDESDSNDKAESNSSDKVESNSSDKAESDSSDKAESDSSDKAESDSSDKAESDSSDKAESDASDKAESDSNDNSEISSPDSSDKATDESNKENLGESETADNE